MIGYETLRGDVSCDEEDNNTAKEDDIHEKQRKTAFK